MGASTSWVFVNEPSLPPTTGRKSESHDVVTSPGPIYQQRQHIGAGRRPYNRQQRGKYRWSASS